MRDKTEHSTPAPAARSPASSIMFARSAAKSENAQGLTKDSDQNNNVAVNTKLSVTRKRFIVAMTGATGAILGIKLLLLLRRLHIETHLVMSHWAEQTIKYETDYSPANVRALADHVYSIHDQAAPISSGSFRCDGMVIVPCSVKTLAGINAGYCNDLISRAADVMLKERRRLVMALRETPLSEIHIRNMLEVTRAGAIICPTVPAFYTKPESIDDMCDQMLGRIMDLFDIDVGGFTRWNGMEKD